MKRTVSTPPATTAALTAASLAAFEKAVEKLRALATDPNHLNQETKEAKEAMQQLGLAWVRVFDVKNTLAAFAELHEVEICKCPPDVMCADCQPYKR